MDLHHPAAAQKEEVSQAPSEGRREVVRGGRRRLTCLAVVLFEFADVFAEELVRVFVVLGLQLEQLRSWEAMGRFETVSERLKWF